MGKKANTYRVTKESDSGRNLQFQNQRTGEKISRSEFVQRIKQGKEPNYHVRNVNNVDTPVSNPDDKKGNNLD